VDLVEQDLLTLSWCRSRRYIVISLRFSGEIALVQSISPIATHFSVA